MRLIVHAGNASARGPHASSRWLVHGPARRAQYWKLARHRQWQVRNVAARAAAELPTQLASELAADRSDNVKDASIEALSKLVGKHDDGIYLACLKAKARGVRARATALKGSARPDVVTAAKPSIVDWRGTE